MRSKGRVPHGATDGEILALIDTWTEAEHVARAVEELAELQVVLLHYRRGKASWDEVLREVGDVELTRRGLRLYGTPGVLGVQEARAALRDSSSLVPAVKIIRQRNGWSLKQALDFVRALTPAESS